MSAANHLRELYQEVIFDHYRRPRNFHPLAQANRRAEGYNPLCGDRIVVHLKVGRDVVEDVSFEGSGCAISIASASLMSEALKGRTLAEAEALFRGFQDMVTAPEATAHAELGKLSVLAGVREFPARVKCATLAWHTLRAALEDQHGAGAVTTETPEWSE